MKNLLPDLLKPVLADFVLDNDKMSFKIQRDITSVACSVFSDFSVSAGLFSSKKLQKPSPLMLVTQLAIYQE